ncbi:GNAT family N-acetyltransferase [Silvimonas iriomotensis]|uniref:GNAT family acetyltransferase n=1 Tax=Silvimonas iriomotensis TaxID=449662 RepID=A0ABQ2PD37_9NEIS|nr:GNAT family protein [Silvimonas iriomotensis]GGP23241.1 GNAT family acetyltransferase [Silvimonas iriomotensis]
MQTWQNDLGQPLGEPLPGWTMPPFPPQQTLSGFGCRLEPLNPAKHGNDLWEAFSADTDGRMWTYLTVGPFARQADLDGWLQQLASKPDPQPYAIVDAETGKTHGLICYLRIAPESASIEVGWVTFSPLLQQTTLATAAQFLLMRNAFALGYRRYEWKCNVLNIPSHKAAERLGFTFEGIFRQATINKGRNRDTTWLSMLDKEWARLEPAYLQWLDADNFDAAGRQRVSLSALTRAALADAAA